MSRKTETLPRNEFMAACPEHLIDQMDAELAQWDGGEAEVLVEFTTDSLGRIDSESSPRPTSN